MRDRFQSLTGQNGDIGSARRWVSRQYFEMGFKLTEEEDRQIFRVRGNSSECWGAIVAYAERVCHAIELRECEGKQNQGKEMAIAPQVKEETEVDGSNVYIRPLRRSHANPIHFAKFTPIQPYPLPENCPRKHIPLSLRPDGGVTWFNLGDPPEDDRVSYRWDDSEDSSLREAADTIWAIACNTHPGDWVTAKRYFADLRAIESAAKGFYNSSAICDTVPRLIEGNLHDLSNDTIWGYWSVFEQK